MGNPDAGSSAYRHDQPQAEYSLQAQDYQFEATHEEFQYQPQPNDPQAQQQFQPPQMQQQQQPQPPPVPIAHQQQQPTRYPPPQTNQPYGAQPSRPAQFSPPNNQMYSNGQGQPGACPVQGSQTIPGQPVQFPPPSPQNNQAYFNGMGQPEAYPPGPQPVTQKSPVYSNEPIKPAAYPPPHGQQPMPAAQQRPVNFPPPAPQASPGVQFQQSNGPQLQYMSVPNPNGSAVQGIPVPSQGKAAWTSGLFDCMNDPMNALVTAFFPCLTFSQVAEIVDEGHTSCGTSGMLYGGIAFCIGLPFIMSCTYRTKLRNKFGLPEAPAPDWVTHFLCEWCALCQEYRELQARGWDPSIGWQGNVASNQNMNLQQATMMAPMNQRMMA